MRVYSGDVTPQIRQWLERLAERPEPGEYRVLMERLGEELGRLAAGRLQGMVSIMLVCSNEDADFLARGVMTSLNFHGFKQLSLACFWNDRVKTTEGDLAPIVRRYVEPSGQVDAMVIVKSIISSSCVVKTNISELVVECAPRCIEVIAPVMLAGAQARLESEFAEDIARKFDYVCFAEDDQVKADGEVVPGIGGSVYELLGIGEPADKNRFTPSLVRERRRRVLT